MITSNTIRARDLAGSAFNDLSDEEVSGTLAYLEKTIGRKLEASDFILFQEVLVNRRTYLDKKAGIAQPKFVPAMYGSLQMTNTTDEPEGY